MLNNKNFTKNDFIIQISNETGFSKNISKKLINDLLKILIQNLHDEKFVLKNFGTFKLIKKKRRIGRNPKNKKEFVIRARQSLTFAASKKTLNFLN
mgnify:CR=1 FL=1